MSRSYMFNDRTQENRRARREEAQVELRQLKREELLNKKRNLSVASAQISNFKEMRDKLYSNDLVQIHQGAYEFRSLLSVEGNPPVQAVIDSGCLVRFVEIMSKEYLYQFRTSELSDDIIDKIRVESAWVLTNIAAGTTEQTKAVIQAGALDKLISMLYEPNEVVVDQSVWALGNIAGDSEAFRDQILNSGALDIIIALLDKYHPSEAHIKLVRNLTWLLSNLNRGRQPPPSAENMKKTLPILFKLISHKDPEIVCDTFWAVSYIADVDSGCTDIILGSNIMGRAYNCLESYVGKLNNQQHDSDDARIGAVSISPIIRMLGNIATGSDNQTNVIVRMGFLNFFTTLFYKIDNKKASRLRKELCWTVSNVTAGPIEQVQVVFESGIMNMLIDAVHRYENFIRKEATWALSNALYHCAVHYEWLKPLLENALLEALMSYLEVANNVPEMQSHILDCIKYSLEGGRHYEKKYGRNIVVDKILDIDALQTIEQLQDVESGDVSSKAYNIIVEYFEGVDS
ncbi:Importin subunit alpha-2 [Nosema granulosis]|uniref:Importin subunit alpha n=1 Tax=Nosema granulosis TaxID=83296 RepID=A0A9P6KZY5_9MICR|nr:Importin subunit alpha-2 [Nosema granulosis]